jgi:hypothetical protein
MTWMLDNDKSFSVIEERINEASRLSDNLHNKYVYNYHITSSN